MKRHAPATARNRDSIAAVLAEELPARGLVLEIASGSGEHAVHFAQLFPNLTWQPSDPDADARASIEAWCAEARLPNLLPAIGLDAGADWPIERAEAILCVNMTHISPPEATMGLFAGAGRVLARRSPLVLYGPFLERDVETAPSNLAFDADLKRRDPAWGLRDTAWLDELAAANGLERTGRVAMLANNLTLVYRQK